MKTDDISKLADKLIEDGGGRSRQQNARFDLNARVEVWVTLDDLEYTKQIEAIKASSVDETQKIAAAKAFAVQVAHQKISSVEGVEITADVSLSDLNVDRIDWVALVTPEAHEPDDDLP